MKEKIKSIYEPFTKGQKVWLEGTNLKLDYNKKITTKREGPFIIKEVLGPVNYQFKLPPRWRIHDVFHASLLTPYTETRVHRANYPHPPPDLIKGQSEWEIERIIGHKGTKNRHYHIKWKGYEETTWEPEENLSQAQESITDYWNRKKIKARNR